jgi:hypothetical protein
MRFVMLSDSKANQAFRGRSLFPRLPKQTLMLMVTARPEIFRQG